MPYGVLERPSIALANLQAVLQQAGIDTHCIYANLRFARRVDTRRYRAIGLSTPEDLLGEWTFSEAAFGCFDYDLAEYKKNVYYDLFDSVGLCRDRFWQGLDYLRSQAGPFILELAEEIVSQRPRVVGCSSSFQQHCASLALLRKIRELDPSIATLMGGANCEGSMGVATRRNFPWVDYVVSGEAEELVVPLVESLLAGQKPPSIYGVLDGRPPLQVPRATVRSLETLPVPVFHDYFRELAESRLFNEVAPALPIETSRGCWWGAKHHCTFCGLNGHGMGFRVKDPDRAVREFDELASTYLVEDFLIVDNILAMDYFQSVLPRLAESPHNYRIFVETKANLKRNQLQALVEAGVRWVLPGFESFHDEVLKLMDKGTTGLINIQTLKWARELGLRMSWSILCGFPGERDEWYGEMAEVIPLLEHLQPPSAVCKVSYHRFSPYHQDAERYGVKHQPGPNYAYVYPISAEEFVDLAYFFVDAPGSSRGPEGPQLQRVRKLVQVWMKRFASGPLPAVLSSQEVAGGLELLDTRAVAPQRRLRLDGQAAEVYNACESIQSLPGLTRLLNADSSQIEAILARLLEQKVLLGVNGRYLALATRGNLPDLPSADQFPGGCAGVHLPDQSYRPWLRAYSAAGFGGSTEKVR